MLSETTGVVKTKSINNIFFIHLLVLEESLTPSKVAEYDKLTYDKVTNYLWYMRSDV